MHWTKIFRRIPDRVWLGIGGIAFAMIVACGSKAFAAWLRLWLHAGS